MTAPRIGPSSALGGVMSSFFTFAPVFALAVFFPLPAVVGAQTSIVAVMTNDLIVIGAGSKETTPDGRETTTFCKIGSTNEVFWARAYYARDSGLNFSADAVAREAILTEGTLKERVSGFERKVEPLLKRIAETRMANDRAWLQSHSEGKPVLQIVFAAFENGRPLMLVRNFRAHIEGNGFRIENRSPRTCPGDCQNGQLAVLSKTKNIAYCSTVYLFRPG